MICSRSFDQLEGLISCDVNLWRGANHNEAPEQRPFVGDLAPQLLSEALRLLCCENASAPKDVEWAKPRQHCGFGGPSRARRPLSSVGSLALHVEEVHRPSFREKARVIV